MFMQELVLRNNEFIVCNSSQCTISYLLELN
jgi:hypothetical protein